jgi:cytochrome P450
MKRFDRPPFKATDLSAQKTDELKNRLIFDWWCDETDRPLYVDSLKGVPTPIPSRALRQPGDDPAPPLTVPVPQGYRSVVLLSDPDHVRLALTDDKKFSNRPYAALGGAAFLLAQDPGAGDQGIDWHDEQQKFIKAALEYQRSGLQQLATLAIAQAEPLSLAQPRFDVADCAEQAALRYMGLLYGYAFQDHILLQEASRATYRALQYLAIGQHFVTEPGTVPAAQQALGQLVARNSELMEDYQRLHRAPRLYGPPVLREWPRGVQPWCELGLARPLGLPLLRRAPDLDCRLSGRDRATVLATLLAGTLGNVVSAVCLLVRSLLEGPKSEWNKVRAISDPAKLELDLERRLARMPPVPVVPRRALIDMTLGGVDIEVGTDCLVLLQGKPGGCPHADEDAACPCIWGDVAKGTQPPAIHACLGRELSMPLIAALVQRTLNLQGLKRARDALTAEPLELERLWGFACTSYPLVFQRERMRKQQNLIIAMHVKPPISENAANLRRLIAAAVPRIEHVLNGFGSVHFAWFEFTDDDAQLVLRTLYDGQFESYIQYFAINAGDLFDGLFEFLEGAPPRPVAEHPQEFIEALRRYNRVPLGGYLYSAHPSCEAPKAVAVANDCDAPQPRAPGSRS